MNFKYKEVVYSEKANKIGVKNDVPYNLMDNFMVSTVGMQRIRDLLGCAIRINSWFRCDKVNELVGGSETSDHPKCLAIDFVPLGMPVREAYNKIIDSDIEYDQLIYTTSKKGNLFIHVGFGPKNRKMKFEKKY